MCHLTNGSSETPVARLIVPQAGDLIVVANSTAHVWVCEIDAVTEKTDGQGRVRYNVARSVRIESGTLRRLRYVRDRQVEGAAAYRDAKDFTYRRLSDRATAGYTLGKYFPQLAGRRVWTYGSSFARPYNYLGRVTIEAPTKPARKPVEIVARENMEFVPGAILYTCWGYEQTNREFFEIVSRKGCWVWIQEIGSIETQQTGWASGKICPNPEHSRGELLKRRVRVYNGREHSCNVCDVRTAYLWDGRDLDYTAYH